MTQKYVGRFPFESETILRLLAAHFKSTKTSRDVALKDGFPVGAVTLAAAAVCCVFLPYCHMLLTGDNRYFEHGLRSKQARSI